jgi:demethylmenaquinone methyltransferase/2-methoxy-6-polyprenyl-1,4-benzoquinol methylase
MRDELRDPGAEPRTIDKQPARVAAIFDAIAPRYDLLNHLLSAGRDRHWRARAIASLELTGRETVLDLCAGTADLALAAVRGHRRAARVLGIDFAREMLACGVRKVGASPQPIWLVQGDATRIPVATASIDATTIAFGIRNVEAPERAFREIYRVLRAGGRLAILEFGIPRVAGIRPLYLWYFRTILPRIGRLVSRHRGAYDYLPASVGAFPPPEAMAAELQTAGFSRVRFNSLTFGIVYLYVGVKPDAEHEMPSTGR